MNIVSEKVKMAKSAAECTKKDVNDIVRDTIKQTQEGWMTLIRKTTAMEKEHRHAVDKCKSEEKQAKEKMKNLEEGYRGKIEDLRRKVEERKRNEQRKNREIEKIETKSEEIKAENEPRKSVNSEISSPEKVEPISENGHEEGQMAPGKEQLEEAKVTKSPVSGGMSRSMTVMETSPVKEGEVSMEMKGPSPVSPTMSAPLVRTFSYKQPLPRPKFSASGRTVSAQDLDLESILGSAASNPLTRSKK